MWQLQKSEDQLKIYLLTTYNKKIHITEKVYYSEMKKRLL